MFFAVVAAIACSLLITPEAQVHESSSSTSSEPSRECEFPCQDIRVCEEARAALIMGGKPPVCAWMPKGVPKVCCGFPAILGPKLEKQVEDEQTASRGCGLTALSDAPSVTGDKFRKILDSLPPIDISDPEKYDPPLDFSFTLVHPAGGRAAVEGADPWMAAIFRGPTFRCGGTVIDKTHIISAAHCFVNSGRDKPDTSLYTVRLGSIYLEKGIPFKVIRIVVPEDYSDRAHYSDIAILTLEEEISASSSVNRICLPDPDLAAKNLTGEKTYLLGWGQSSFWERRVPLLHVVRGLPVVSNHQCNNAFQNVSRGMLPRGLTDDFICAGLKEGGKDACQYDSGGPLLYSYNKENLLRGHPNIPKVLVGIVSFGFGCAVPGIPGAYTRVSSYMDWILRNIAD